MQLSHGLLERVHHGGVLLVRDDGYRRVGAHAARVGTAVALERALVVLARTHGTHGLAISEGQKRALGTGHHLLDDHRGTGLAERTVKAGAHGVLGLRELGRHDHALAGSQAVGLDHERSTLIAHVGERRGFIGKAGIRRRGNAGALHELLGELLGTLHLGALGTGAKAGNAHRAHGVGHAHDERGLGSDNDQAAAGLAGKVRHRRGILGVKQHVLAHRSGTAVTRRDVKLVAAR